MLKVETPTPGADPLISFATMDDLVEIICTHMRGKVITTFIPPGRVNPDIDRGYVGATPPEEVR
jgi:hypothetical protein